MREAIELLTAMKLVDPQAQLQVFVDPATADRQYSYRCTSTFLGHVIVSPAIVCSRNRRCISTVGAVSWTPRSSSTGRTGRPQGASRWRGNQAIPSNAY
jgi:hypothetical protein